ALDLGLDDAELPGVLGREPIAEEELRVPEDGVQRRAELVRDRRRHLPERREPLAAADLELRAPELLVRRLELAIGLGELVRRLADPRLETRRQVFDRGQHLVEAPPEERELAAARRGDARAELAGLGAPHAVDEDLDRTRHAPPEEDREQQRDDD